jgi:hypothetical protein
MRPRGRRSAHALDPRLPRVDSVLRALRVLSATVSVDTPAPEARGEVLSIAYRLLFAELAAVAGVEVRAEDAVEGLDAPDRAPLEDARACLDVDPAWVEADVTGLGRLHEELLAWQPVAEDGRWVWREEGRLRKASGAYFTPPVLVDHVLGETLEPVIAATPGAQGAADLRVLDPACGAGAFLVPAARRLARVYRAAGRPPTEAWRQAAACVHGADLDRSVLELARVCLWLAPLAERGDTPGTSWSSADLVVDVPLVHGDAVAGVVEGSAFDVVVGNPPFANQLERLTARDAAATRRLNRHGGGVAAYTDLSAVFLMRALTWVVPGGRVGLVQPTSVLSVRDAAPVRRAVARAGALRSVWSAGAGVFDAAVPTCALVVEVGGAQGPIRRWQGPAVAPGPDLDVGPDGLGDEWGRVLAAGLGIPEVTLAGAGVVGDLADCTADFRDQYYGLAPYVREASPKEGGAPLVTSGLVDPAVCRWGSRSTRFLKQTWQAPLVDLDALAEDPKLGPWATRRLVPKVLVATQGKVLEAVADPEGQLLPSVPVVTVQPRDPDDVWRLLAVLLAPPVCAHAAARYAGSALNPDAVKLSATQVAALPLPSDREAWDHGTREVRAAQEASTDGERHHHLLHAGRRLCTAYGVHGEAAGTVLRWWVRRLPR